MPFLPKWNTPHWIHVQEMPAVSQTTFGKTSRLASDKSVGLTDRGSALQGLINGLSSPISPGSLASWLSWYSFVRGMLKRHACALHPNPVHGDSEAFPCSIHYGTRGEQAQLSNQACIKLLPEPNPWILKSQTLNPLIPARKPCSILLVHIGYR